MNTEAYEVLALAMRYVFAGLMVLIVLRALRGVLIDSRRAASLRHLSPETGIIGELLITDGDRRAPTGTRYPLTLEGTLGSSATADIRVRGIGVHRRHAIYRMTERGLYVRGHAGAYVVKNRQRPAREALLSDGDTLRVGGISLLLVLTEADALPDEMTRRVRRREADARHRRRENQVPEEESEDIFDASGENGDEMFRVDDEGDLFK